MPNTLHLQTRRKNFDFAFGVEVPGAVDAGQQRGKIVGEVGHRMVQSR